MIKVADEYKTIQKIIDTGASIARYGDGELKLCIGKKQMSQLPSPKIAQHLRLILRQEVPNLLVGIPRIYSGSDYPIQDSKKREFWKRYRKQQYLEMYEESRQYYSAFISRPDSANEIDCPEYWAEVKKIWDGRKVVLLQGEGRRFHKDLTLLNSARSVEIIYGPRRDAYKNLNELIELLMAYPSNRLFILSLGPTATVLAYEMAQRGRQALDLGHMGMFYAHIHPKSSKYTGEYYDVDK
jgi:glycosyltransferase family protein